MTKYLGSTTIIPKELYVERNADKELSNVISSMETPGYILVARQMGKTNLLFNAKRIDGSKQKIYPYIDCSKSINSDANFYNNIIDTIIATNYSIFSSFLSSDRVNESAPIATAYQYESLLIGLLKIYQGSIIIILDEIDFLTNYKFSDNIFATIRSLYFSRINFSELGRVTYILSGVAEPIELIKDSRRSPFNIGKRITLNNFSITEVYSLVKRARLEISNQLVEKIYEWSAGHPRITWDICSALEDILIEYGSVNENDLDRTLDKLYFSMWSLPPIDNIRNQIKIKAPLRKSYRNLLKGNLESISKEEISQLYLAGILRDMPNVGEKISINNKILKHVINEQFLDICESTPIESLFKDAKNYYKNGEFKIALENFIEVINQCSQSDLKEILLKGRLYVGMCYIKLEEYDKVIEWIQSDSSSDSEFNPSFFSNLMILTRAYYGKSDYEQCHRISRKSLDYKNINSTQTIFAKFNIAFSLFKANMQAHRFKIFDIYNEILLSSEQLESNNPIKSLSMCSAYFGIGKLHQNIGDLKKAEEYFQLADEYSSTFSCPGIYLALFCLNTEKSSQTYFIDLFFENIKTPIMSTHDVNRCDFPILFYEILPSKNLLFDGLVSIFQFDKELFFKIYLPLVCNKYEYLFISESNAILTLSPYIIAKYGSNLEDNLRKSFSLRNVKSKYDNIRP
jgi:tetratricopeptide (TPR) repeat protein